MGSQQLRNLRIITLYNSHLTIIIGLTPIEDLLKLPPLHVQNADHTGELSQKLLNLPLPHITIHPLSITHLDLRPLHYRPINGSGELLDFEALAGEQNGAFFAVGQRLAVDLDEVFGLFVGVVAAEVVVGAPFIG